MSIEPLLLGLMLINILLILVVFLLLFKINDYVKSIRKIIENVTANIGYTHSNTIQCLNNTKNINNSIDKNINNVKYSLDKLFKELNYLKQVIAYCNTHKHRMNNVSSNNDKANTKLKTAKNK